MARIFYNLATTAEVALTTGTKTILQIGTNANQRISIKGMGISFDGVSSTAGVPLVELCTQTTGTQSGTAATATKTRMGTSEAVQTTGLFNFSAEPTLVAILRPVNVVAQTGYERVFTQEEEIEVSGGTRVGLRVTGYAGSTAVNCNAWLEVEE